MALVLFWICLWWVETKKITASNEYSTSDLKRAAYSIYLSSPPSLPLPSFPYFVPDAVVNNRDQAYIWVALVLRRVNPKRCLLYPRFKFWKKIENSISYSIFSLIMKIPLFQLQGEDLLSQSFGLPALLNTSCQWEIWHCIWATIFSYVLCI